MVLDRPAPIETAPLRPEDRPTPVPAPGELLVRVEVCGVCRTDLHVVEGDLPPVPGPLVPGHEVVGTVVGAGEGPGMFAPGTRVGIPWLRSTCGRCEYCRTGRENLCDAKRFTGYTDPGGYAEFATAPAAFVHPVPAGLPAERWAPFLCAGIIGYRALRRALPRPGGRIGLFGFGGSAHLALQVADRWGYETVVYSRDPAHVELARRLGATEAHVSAGEGPSAPAPTLDGAVVFAPSGEVVLQALRSVKKGATVAIAGIHVSPIPSIDYDRFLFGERALVSVEANTRADAAEFLALAARLRLEATVRTRPLVEANEALADLKADRVSGAVVLTVR